MRSPQTPRDRVLWALTVSNGKLNRKRLRQRSRVSSAELIEILNGLAREGRIKQSLEENPKVSIKLDRERVLGASKKRRRSKKRSKRSFKRCLVKSA